MTFPSRSRRQQAKEFLRQIAIGLSGGVLDLVSRPYQLRELPAVVIAPHQDDETLACGGVIARKRNEGLPVHVIFITDGSASHPDHPRLNRRDIAALRAREAMQAMAQLGVERTAVHFLNEPDGSLKTITPARREDLVRRLTGLLGRINPAEIFLPCNPDGSSEHDATFGFVLDAVGRAGLQPDVWQYPVWSWWNPLLLVHRWLAAPDCRRLAVEDYQQAKQHAIACYQSQIAPIPPDHSPALPAGLVAIFNSDTEYFFLYPLPAPTPPAPTAGPT
jgi:LmbE family N-acetylglucosaminyl deacetylase